MANSDLSYLEKIASEYKNKLASKYLEKIAIYESENKDNIQESTDYPRIPGMILGIAGASAGKLATKTIHDKYLQDVIFNKNFFSDIAPTKYDPHVGFDSLENIMRNAGYTERREVENGVDGFYNPKTNKSIAVPGLKQGTKSRRQEEMFTASGPHALPGKNTYFDGSNSLSASLNEKLYDKLVNSFGSTTPNTTIINIGKGTPEGIIAHEIGHATAMNDRTKIHKSGLFLNKGSIIAQKLSPTFLTISPLLSKSIEEEEEIDKYTTLGLTALTLPQIFGELQASYRGAKYLKGRTFKKRLSPFIGIPTYALTAITPSASYGAKKVFNKAFGRTKKLKEDTEND